MIIAERCAVPSFEPPWRGAIEQCVVFALCAQTYAVAAGRLHTCLSLPRLTPLDETPAYLVGAFDLRGELTPVVNLAVLSGSELQPAAIGDLLIVVDAGGYPLALHADTMLGLEPLCAQPWQRHADAGEARQINLSGGRAQLIDPARISLVLETDCLTERSADERLRHFERELDSADLALLETRAERYRN